MKGWTVINTDVLLIPPESGTTEKANCNFDKLHSKLRQRLGVGGEVGKLRRGPWDLFDREVRYLQRESLSNDITPRLSRTFPSFSFLFWLNYLSFRLKNARAA